MRRCKVIFGIDNIEQFRAFFDVVHESTTVVQFQIFKDKLVCSLLDKSHTNFYSVKFEEDFFYQFDVESEDMILLDADDLYKLLKSCKKTDKLFLEVDNLYLTAVVESENGNRRVFEYVLLDMDYASPNFPPIVYDTEFEVDTNDLKQSVTDLNLIGTNLYKMSVSGDNLCIFTGDSARTKYSHSIDIDPETPTKMIVSGYSIDFIERMLKFNKVNKVVEIGFGHDKPLSYLFKGDSMCIKGLIAPRIEED